MFTFGWSYHFCPEVHQFHFSGLCRFEELQSLASDGAAQTQRGWAQSGWFRGQSGYIYKQFTNNLQTIYKQFTHITHHKENKRKQTHQKPMKKGIAGQTPNMPAILSIISTCTKISTQIQGIMTAISSFIALHFVLSGNTTREMQNQLVCTVFLLWHCLRKE